MSDIDDAVSRLETCTVKTFDAPGLGRAIRYPDNTASPYDVDLLLKDHKRLLAMEARLKLWLDADGCPLPQVPLSILDAP
jgi:hypothetical protein